MALGSGVFGALGAGLWGGAGVSVSRAGSPIGERGSCQESEGAALSVEDSSLGDLRCVTLPCYGLPCTTLESVGDTEGESTG